jgi:hypothetical protein
VTNPSGGLLSKGHPLGATGLAQCFELTHQLRGSAGARQVEGARVALQHNLGLGGACVVTLYTVRSVVSDIYDKKNGALEFVVKTARATNQRDELVAELRTVIVCRN